MHHGSIFVSEVFMTPRFYGFLWAVFAITAGILWLGGVFTMLTAVVLGFISFGLTFIGMMCVLPGVVSHPPVTRKVSTVVNRNDRIETAVGNHGHAQFPMGLRTH